MTTLPPVREWRLHMGAHKTATTHIQYRLEALRQPLFNLGLDVMVPESGVRRLAISRMHQRPPKFWRLRPRRPERLTGLLESLRRGPDRVLISEEQMLGQLGSAVVGSFYDRYTYFAALLGTLSKTTKVELFICTRSMETFLPSAYSQMLRWEPPPTEKFDAIRQAIRKDPKRWSSLVCMLRRHAPLARLTVWRYEDYPHNTNEVLARLCGLETLPEAPVIPPPTRTKSGSAAAIRVAERLPEHVVRKQRKAQVAEIYTDPALAGAPFDPFSADDKDYLAELYEHDWAWIRKHAPETIMPLGSRAAS